MKKLTYSKLIEKVSALRGTAIVGLMALTNARARKTGNPFGDIFKQTRSVAFVGADYESAVNREATRQGVEENFVGEKLPWGAWLIPNKVIQNKGKFYLRTQFTPGQRKRQPARLLAYRTAKGQFLSPDDVKPFLPIARESEKQQSIGLNKTIWVRDYSFESIRKIRIQGETFELVPDVV